jgi:hypothetical protein
LLHEDETTFIFSINPTWLNTYDHVILAATFLDNKRCAQCSQDPGFNYDNYSFITNKNGIEDIKTVRVDIAFALISKDKFNQTIFTNVTEYFPFNWVRS